MKKLFLLLCTLVALCANAQVASDTLSLTVSRTEAEPDPNNQEFVFSLFGAADLDYKIQIDYHSASMYGTFSDTDFDLSGSGKNYNYIRTTDGTKFWSFKHLDVVVSDSLGATVVTINGLIQNLGSWRRVLATGVLAAPAPADTTVVDMGTVAVIRSQRDGVGFLIMDAANADYSLEFGLTGYNRLAAGTYVQRDMLYPVLVHLPADTISAKTAELLVTDSTVAGLHQLRLDLITADNHLYRLLMHTDLLRAVDTVAINCTTTSLQAIEMYNIYQFVGNNATYSASLAVRPGVIEKGMLVIPEDSIDLAHTQVYHHDTQVLTRIQQASAYIVVDSTTTINKQMIYADLLGANDTLYQVLFTLGGSDLPAASDTTIIECGNRVGRLDYTHGAGYLGLVLGNDTADVHITVYNGLEMRGTFTSDMFVYDDPKSYVTTYSAEDSVIRFSDVQAAEMYMDSIGDTVRIELDVVTVSSHMYRFRANLLPMRALTGTNINYVVNNALTDDGMMVALRMAKQGNASTYRLQFQRSDEWTAEGEMTGDNHELWDYSFTQDSIDGISGSYGYAAGTLNEDYAHTIVEKGTEILLRPMAGTLTLTVAGDVTIPAEYTPTGVDYHTHLYAVTSHMAMENGLLYHVTGQNYLLCVDYNSGAYLEFSEDELTALNDILAPQGLRVRKVLRDGMLLLETTDSTYTIQGQLAQ